jgi:hypothetical protein
LRTPASSSAPSSTPASSSPDSASPVSSSAPSSTPAQSYILSDQTISGIENAASSMYTGASNIGIFFAFGKMIIHILISIFLFFIGITIITTPKSVSLTCKIISINNSSTDSKCNKIEVGLGDFNCRLGIEYTVQGKTYNKIIEYVGKTEYNIGNDITLYYKDGSDVTDPSNFTFNKDPDISIWNKLFGFFLILVGIIYSSYSVMNFIAAKNYKVIGAAQGAGTVKDFMIYGTKSMYF